MKKKSFFAKALFAVSMLAVPAMFTSCSDNDDDVSKPGNDIDLEEGQPEGSVIIGGTIKDDMTLSGDSTYWLANSMIISEGVTLTVEAGAKVYVSPYTNPEIVVAGNIYAWGTVAEPILFTLSEKHPDYFDYGRYNWGGIIGRDMDDPNQEIGMTYVTVEYAGGPVNENSEAVRNGKLEPGELGYSIFFNNNKGQVYMENCTVAHSGGDAIYIERGKIALFHNTVAYAGTTEDEAFNFKQGTVGDCGFNLMYSAATNGIKINNSKPIEGDPQTNVNMYNNTMAYCGWRRDGERGGSINIEKNARGLIANNLIVNSKYGTKVDASADVENIRVRNNYYYGVVDAKDEQGGNGYLPHHGILFEDEYFWTAFNGSCNFFDGENLTSDLQDPQFVNFIDATPNVDADAAMELDYKDMDFAIEAESPAATFGTDEQSLLSEQVVTSVGGVSINRPELSKVVGAFGTK
nr:right-handed parallel beta-helix repeat-containing protein [uncultured Carboxylicivirga sp.]